MTVFIHRHNDEIYAGELKVANVSAKNPYTMVQCKAGATWLDLTNPLCRSIVEVHCDKELCAVLSEVLGEEVAMVPLPNKSIDSKITVKKSAPGDFFFWRGVCIGSDDDDGLHWYGGSKELQWRPIHACEDRTPAIEIMSELVRRALRRERDQELPEWRGWELLP